MPALDGESNRPADELADHRRIGSGAARLLRRLVRNGLDLVDLPAAARLVLVLDLRAVIGRTVR